MTMIDLLENSRIENHERHENNTTVTRSRSDWGRIRHDAYAKPQTQLLGPRQ